MSGSVVIAGGGLAGGAAACGLAQAGRAVTLFEREAAPAHKICGEFLSIEAQEALSALGLDVGTLGGAPISRFRLICDDWTVAIDLPFRGLGLSRLRLDEALLDHATACGAVVRRGVAVRAVDTTDGIVLDLAGGTTLRPETLLLATGKHDLRGARRQHAQPEDLVGFKMYFRLHPAAQTLLEAHIELHLFTDGYAGLQMVEDGMANLSLLVGRARLRRVGGQWSRLLDDLKAHNAVLAERLDRATPLLDQPLTIYRVPYGFIHQPRDDDPPRLFRLGDQAGVIPSFTGDGMAIALHSAARATEAIRAGTAARTYHATLRRDIAGQIRRASALYRITTWSPTRHALLATARTFPNLLSLAVRYTRVRADGAKARSGGFAP